MRRRRNRQLTTRELEILRLVAAGYENSEIGKKLIIGEYTVQSHVARILNKLNAFNRSHAVAIALRARKIAVEDIPEITNET